MLEHPEHRHVKNHGASSWSDGYPIVWARSLATPGVAGNGNQDSQDFGYSHRIGL
jgi:hypothetical protein